MRNSLLSVIEYLNIVFGVSMAMFLLTFAILPEEVSYIGLKTNGGGFDLYYLNALLTSYHFSSDYDKGVFDCSQMSILVHDFMEEHNFSTKIAMRKINETENRKTYHTFLVVDTAEGEFIIETTSDPLNRIGTITYDLDGYAELYEPEELQNKTNFSPKEWTTNETILPKYTWADCGISHDMK